MVKVFLRKRILTSSCLSPGGCNSISLECDEQGPSRQQASGCRRLSWYPQFLCVERTKHSRCLMNMYVESQLLRIMEDVLVGEVVEDIYLVIQLIHKSLCTH
eukprot:sb/3478417/